MPARAPSRAALVPVAVAIGVMVLWGATPIVTRLALDDLPPLVVACLRTVLAGLVAIPLLAGMRQRLPTDRGSRTLLGISAAAGFVIFPVVYTVGQQRTSALHGVMILAALPVFTGAYAAIVARRAAAARVARGLRRRARRRGRADRRPRHLGERTRRSPATCSCSPQRSACRPATSRARCCRRAGSRASPRRSGACCSGRSCSRRSPSGSSPATACRDAGAKAWGAVVFLAVVTSILGYVGWYWALDRGGIARIATLQFLQPVSGFVLAAIVLGENVTRADRGRQRADRRRDRDRAASVRR